MNDDSNDKALSKAQLKVLIVLTVCSSVLSVIGSSAIVFKILRDWIRYKRTTPYDRIILGLSTFDILASITLGLNRFLAPSPSPWSIGNDATCSIIGFMGQVSLCWAIWYNCLLSYYFHFTVLARVRLQNFVKRYEPWMHASGSYFLITGIVGYAKGWYAEQGLSGGCWVVDPLLKWLFGGIPLLFAYVSMIANYFVIYSVLRMSLRSSSEQHGGQQLAQETMKREAMTIMLLYIALFVSSITPHFLVQNLEAYFGYTYDNASPIYPLLIVQVTLLPLQGCFNFGIYIRPLYTRFRAANPSKPPYVILHQALFDPDIPAVAASREQSSANAAERDDARGNPHHALFHSTFLSNNLEQEGSELM